MRTLRWALGVKGVHPCPCCGYRTLPTRGDYEVCPVCGWEDESVEVWEVSGPNGVTLAEQQRAYLADPRSHHRGRHRSAPRRRERRPEGWEPITITPELVRQVERSHEAEAHDRALSAWRLARQAAPGPSPEELAWQEAWCAIRDAAPGLGPGEVAERLLAMGAAQGIRWPPRHLELLSHTMVDPAYYRRHPVAAARWLVRHARPGSLRSCWRELRSGVVRLAG